MSALDEDEPFQTMEDIARTNGFVRFTLAMAKAHFENNKTKPIACLVGLTMLSFIAANEDPSALEYNVSVSFTGAVVGVGADGTRYFAEDKLVRLGDSLPETKAWSLPGIVHVSKTHKTSALIVPDPCTKEHICIVATPDLRLSLNRQFGEDLWIRQTDVPSKYARRERKKKQIVDY